jgi:hypothetical protein
LLGYWETVRGIFIHPFPVGQLLNATGACRIDTVIIYCSTRLEKDSLLLEARKSSSRFYPSSSYYSSSRYRFSAIVLEHHPRRS